VVDEAHEASVAGWSGGVCPNCCLARSTRFENVIDELKVN
jgi:hypothetical protein